MSWEVLIVLLVYFKLGFLRPATLWAAEEVNGMLEVRK